MVFNIHAVLYLFVLHCILLTFFMSINIYVHFQSSATRSFYIDMGTSLLPIIAILAIANNMAYLVSLSACLISLKYI